MDGEAVDEAAQLAAAATDEVAGAASATFGNLKASRPGTISAPTASGTPRKKNIAVKFDGPAPDINTSYRMYTSNSTGPVVKVLKRNKGVKAKYVVKPYVYGPGTAISPLVTNTAKISVYKYTTPGLYQVTIPVSKRTYNGSTWTWNTKTIKVKFAVKANSKNSRAITYFTGSARAHKTFPIMVNAPNYQAGAKVTVYYKPKGKKKYTKVKVGRLKAKNSSYSKVVIKVAKKYNLGGRGGSVKVKVSGVGYSPSYTSKVQKLKKWS